MIEVNGNSFHARMYRWWYQAKYGATRDGELLLDENNNYIWNHDKGRYAREVLPNLPERSNLCPYMRAVLFWSWMRFLFLDGRIGKLRVPIVTWLAFAIELPRWVGIVSYDLKQTILLIYLSFVTAGAAIGVAHVAAFLLKRYTKTHPVVYNPNHKPNRAIEEVRELSHLIGEYLRSFHDRVCPEITFKH